MSLGTKHRRLAADMVEGMRARMRDTGLARQTCPFNDSNFDRPRRDAWREGWDFAGITPKRAEDIIAAIERVGGRI